MSEEIEWHCRNYECGNVIKENEMFCKSCLAKYQKKELIMEGYFPPPWNPNEFPEKTEGWIEFQKYLREDPEYYLMNFEKKTTNKENDKTLGGK